MEPADATVASARRETRAWLSYYRLHGIAGLRTRLNAGSARPHPNWQGEQQARFGNVNRKSGHASDGSMASISRTRLLSSLSAK